MNEHNVIEIKDLSVDFMTVRGIVYAVQGVDLSVKEGEIHGVVGESGCGKSVSTKSIMRLHDEKHTRYSFSRTARAKKLMCFRCRRSRCRLFREKILQ